MHSSTRHARPTIPPSFLRWAKELNKKIVHVCLLDKDEAINQYLLHGTTPGKPFHALTDFLPQKGDTIRAENGELCTVTDIIHNVGHYEEDSKTQFFLLITTVFATLIEQKKDWRKRLLTFLRSLT